MDSDSSTKRVQIFGKLAGTLIGILGAYVIGSMLLSSWRTFHGHESMWEMFASLIFTGIMFAAGVYCLFVAYRVWSNVSADAIRRISLIAAVVFSLAPLALVKIAGIFGAGFSEWPWFQLIPLSAVIVGGAFYLLCSKLLLRWLALPKVVDWARREKAVRTLFSWLAFFVFIALSAVLMHLAPKEQGDTYAPKYFSAFWMGLLGPGLAAYLVYKLGVYITLRNRHTDPD